MIKTKKILHHENERLFIIFPFDRALIEKVKTLKDARWSATHRAWHIPYNKYSLGCFSRLFPDLDISEYLQEFSEENNKSKECTQNNIKTGIRIEYSYEKIRIWLSKNLSDIAFLRTFRYGRWNPTQYCWVIPNYDENLSIIRLHFGDRIVSIKEVLKKKTDTLKKLDTLTIPSEVNNYALQLSKWMEHKRYSPSSIKSYVEAARIFLAYTYPKPIDKLENSDMVDFVNNYIIPRRLSYSFQNQVINAIKLLFKEIINSEIDIDKLERPRREHKLPNVLSKKEVKDILDSPENIKHKAMLSVIYACGLRRSELLKIRPNDVNSSRMLLIIRNSKGNKDRVVPISDKIIELLRTYYKKYKPKVWLFEGMNEGEQYTASSLQKVLKIAVLKSGIRKPVTLHWLRHSYATHLLEAGVDLRYIQELLGHKSSRTTEVYTDVSTKNLQNIKSPFDDL